MPRVKIYSTSTCPICDKTKTLLSKWRIPFEEVRVDGNPALIKEMLAATNGSRRVPQITIDGEWIGGFSELTELHMEGRLEQLVSDTVSPGAN